MIGTSKMNESRIAGELVDFFRVPTQRFRGDRGRVSFSMAFLTDTAWRGFEDFRDDQCVV